MFVDNKTAEQIKENFNENCNLPLEDILLEIYSKEVVTQDDKKLLNLAFSENPSREDLDEFLNEWDLEKAGGGKALLLSYFMKRHPNLKFSKYEEPRLQGMLKYARFFNLKKIAHFTKVGKALNKAGIPVMIIKGGAMKFIRPNMSRVMGDIDILVPEKFYYKTAEIAKNLGYDCSFEPHSVDLHVDGNEEGTVDIHQYIFMDTGHEKNLNKSLFARAKKAKVFGVNAYVPSFEDMVFLSLVNMAKNLRNQTSSTGILFTLFDCKFLIENKPDFDWNIVIQNAKRTQTQISMAFAIKFVNSIVSGILPDEFQKGGLFKREMNNYCKIIMFERFEFPDFQEKVRAIKFLDSIKSFNGIIKYLGVKTKYKCLKFYNKSVFMKNLYLKYAK